MTDPSHDATWTSPPKARKWLRLSLAGSLIFTAATVWLLLNAPTSGIYRGLSLLGASGTLSAASGLVPSARSAKALLAVSFVALALALVFVFRAL